MCGPVPMPAACPKPARAPLSAAVIGSPEPLCPVCSTARGGRLWKSACSARCRAALSRRRRAEAQSGRDRKVRELLKAALRMVGH